MVMDCEAVLTQVSAYLEGDLPIESTRALDRHLASCRSCAAVVNGTRNMLQLVADPRAFPLPEGFSDRLRQRLKEYGGASACKPVRLGIGGENASSGDHMAYFWENDRDFEQGIGFLVEGIKSGDHCVIFGYEQANLKVLSLLRARGFDVEELVRDGQLRILAGRSSGQEMLAEIGADFQLALEQGATMIRLLGNIGWGRQGWPADDDILRFEARVTEAARRFPCLILCMYDVASLAGRIILKGGFQTHPVTICDQQQQQNPLYQKEADFLAHLPAPSERIQ